MNENYYNLIREVTEKYDYAHKDKVKYNKNDDVRDKAIKIYSSISMGIHLRRKVLFIPAVPVIIDCLGIIVTDKKEKLYHLRNYEAKSKIFDNRHETLQKLFRTIGHSKHEPEEVFKDEVKNSGFKVTYIYQGEPFERIHNYALLGKRIYRIKLHQWCYCFERDYNYINYDDYQRSRYTTIRLSIHEPDIEDITYKCLASASGNKKPSKSKK